MQLGPGGEEEEEIRRGDSPVIIQSIDRLEISIDLSREGREERRGKGEEKRRIDTTGETVQF